MKFLIVALSLASLAVFLPITAYAVTIETVVVGDPGNAPDVDYLSDGGRGAVAYTYEIGKYQVTNSEYTEFLNADRYPCAVQYRDGSFGPGWHYKKWGRRKLFIHVAT